MQKEKLNSLIRYHLVLMAILGVLSAVAFIVYCYAAFTQYTDVTGKSVVYSAANATLFQTLAMCAGIVYLSKGYGKKDAGFYKAFLVFAALSFIGTIMYNIFTLKSDGPSFVNILCFVLMLCIFVLLLVLAFGKDMGKRNTWRIFSVLLVLAVVLFCINLVNVLFDGVASVVMTITFHLTRLLMIGTIGIAIIAKYADKTARGTL